MYDLDAETGCVLFCLHHFNIWADEQLLKAALLKTLAPPPPILTLCINTFTLRAWWGCLKPVEGLGRGAGGLGWWGNELMCPGSNSFTPHPPTPTLAPYSTHPSSPTTTSTIPPSTPPTPKKYARWEKWNHHHHHYHRQPLTRGGDPGRASTFLPMGWKKNPAFFSWHFFNEWH